MNLKPTEQMAKNAERGLKLRKEFNRGGTEVGVARATQLKNRENLSPETVKRMVSYFARHAGDNLSETDPPSAGYIAWLLWGGDAGRDWAERKAKQIDEQKENEMKAIEQKKLAIIKSNAAPEVKLKALEVLSNEELSPEEIRKRFGKAKQKAKPFPIQELEKAKKEYETAKKDKSIDPEKLKKISDRYQDLLRKYQDSLKNSYKNADSKLDPAKLALSKMLDQLGYKAMAREVMQESDIQALKKYARVVISEFEKAKSPKADRVKSLLGQLGVSV